MNDEHPVTRKLRQDMLPYFVSARQLRFQWYYRLHAIFGYTTDVIVAFTALGLSSPLLEFLANGSMQNGDGNPPHQLTSILASVSGPFYWSAVVLVTLWVGLRVAFRREEGEKRAVLARSCNLTLRQAEAKLPPILASNNPMPALTELFREMLPIVHGNIKENAWPWTPFAPGIDETVDSYVKELHARFGANWSDIESRDYRALPE